MIKNRHAAYLISIITGLAITILPFIFTFLLIEEFLIKLTGRASEEFLLPLLVIGLTCLFLGSFVSGRIISLWIDSPGKIMKLLLVSPGIYICIGGLILNLLIMSEYVWELIAPFMTFMIIGIIIQSLMVIGLSFAFTYLGYYTKMRRKEECNNMTTQKFSKGEAIRFGWNTMKSNLGLFIGLLIVAGLIYFAPEIIYGFLGLLGKERPVFSILDLISIIFSMIIWLGFIKISLNFCDNIKSKISDLFSQYRLFFRFLFASILYGLIVFPGLILLIIPGIYLAIRFWFYDYFIVDKRAGVIECLKRSWKTTQGTVWNLFLFGLLLAGIILLGALCLVIGLFAAIPTTLIAFAFVYRKLLTQIESAQAPQPSIEGNE